MKGIRLQASYIALHIAKNYAKHFFKRKLPKAKTLAIMSQT